MRRARAVFRAWRGEFREVGASTRLARVEDACAAVARAGVRAM